MAAGEPEGAEHGGGAPGVVGLGEQQDLIGGAGIGGQQDLQAAGSCQFVHAAERGDHMLTDLSARAHILDDLEIGAAARAFLAERAGSGNLGSGISGVSA